MDVHVEFRDGWAIRRRNGALEDGIISTRCSDVAAPDESNRSPVRMLNACGYALTTNRHPNHRAWQIQPSIFGRINEAFTMAGNVIMRKHKVIFKGATSPQALDSVLHTILDEPTTAQLQLVVISMGIGRCLFVMIGCLLERRLMFVPWASVMHRIEEVCSVVVFYIVDWRAMETALGIQPWTQPPKTTTVSVTRRGTMTLRLTWDAADWVNNDAFYDAARHIGKFVRSLV